MQRWFPAGSGYFHPDRLMFGFGLNLKLLMILTTVGALLITGAYWLGRLDGRRLAALSSSENVRKIELDANRKLSEAVWEVQTQAEKLAQLEGQLNREAEDDPDAEQPALNAASVQRLNRY